MMHSVCLDTPHQEQCLDWVLAVLLSLNNADFERCHAYQPILLFHSFYIMCSFLLDCWWRARSLQQRDFCTFVLFFLFNSHQERQTSMFDFFLFFASVLFLTWASSFFITFLFLSYKIRENEEKMLTRRSQLPKINQ